MGQVTKLAKYCVLMVVFNEEKTIGKLLRAVLEQEGPAPAVVWVVSDASTDATDEMVERFGNKSGLVKLVKNPQRVGKVASLVKAKRLVGGYNCVILLDGDIEIRDKKLFRRLLRVITGQKNAGLAAGEVRYVKSPNSSGWLYAARMIDNLAMSAMYEKYGVESVKVAGGCLVVAGELMTKVKYTVSAAEDYELYVWAKKLGKEIDWVPSAVVYHPVPPSLLAGYSEYTRNTKGMRLIGEKYKQVMPEFRSNYIIRTSRLIFYREWLAAAVKKPRYALTWLGVRLIYKYWQATGRMPVVVSNQIDNYWTRSNEV